MELNTLEPVTPSQADVDIQRRAALRVCSESLGQADPVVDARDLLEYLGLIAPLARTPRRRRIK